MGNEMTQPTRRTSRAATGIKDEPRRIPAYPGDDSPGKKFSDADMSFVDFVTNVPAQAERRMQKEECRNEAQVVLLHSSFCILPLFPTEPPVALFVAKL